VFEPLDAGETETDGKQAKAIQHALGTHSVTGQDSTLFADSHSPA
jgi:hypothetical protein